MARKITLTVPDALYSKINLWRDAFNLSRIFQDAVTEAIRKKEEFQNRMTTDHSLTDIISRLKKEKEGMEKSLAETAEKAGEIWASRAHYEELILAVNSGGDTLFKLPQIQEELKKVIDQFSTLPDAAVKLVQDSWLEGVREFWGKVRDRL
ncbi:MAG: hypothetical protein PQJ50_13000 [Spirochaetales bacterium]|nr:hypothetical protein [Spirochaetales bacterium]